MDETIYALLSGDSTVTSLVGSNIYPVNPPATEDVSELLPFIVYSLTDNVPLEDLDGPVSLSMVYVDVDVYSVDYDTNASIVSAVKAVLNGYRNLPSVASIRLLSVQTPDEELGFHTNLQFVARVA